MAAGKSKFSELSKDVDGKWSATGRQKNRTKEHEHLQRRTASTDEKEKYTVKEECKRLQIKLAESENEKGALKLSHEQEVGAYKEEITKLNDRYKENCMKSVDAKMHLEEKIVEYKIKLMKSDCAMMQLETKIAELKRKLDETENEKVALKLNHKHEIDAYEEEYRKLKESMIDVSTYEKKEKELQIKCDEIWTDIARYKEKWTKSEEEKIQMDIRLKELERKLDESENEKVALKLKHTEEIKAHDEENRKLQDSMTVHDTSKEKEKEMQTKCEELEADIACYKENWTKSENEKVQLDIQITELKRKLGDSENEKVATKLKHTEEIKVHEEENRKLQESMTVHNTSKEKEKEMQTKYDELEADIASYKENWTKSEDGKVQLEIKITELEGKLDESENENFALKLSHKEEIQAHEEKNRKLKERFWEERKDWEREVKTLKDQYNRLEAKTNQMANQLDNERKAKEDDLIRLSSMASNKLRDNNPNLTGLGDPNRPTKLSEKFSELFDNEWTDAFDELEKLLGVQEDKEIIFYLMDILLEINSVCSEVSSSKLIRIEEEFVKPSAPSDNTKIPSETFKIIKDGIKSMAPKLLQDTKELVHCRLETKYMGDPVADCLQNENVKRYIEKCTEVCWYMSVQDPQVVMDGSKSPDDKFDSNRHREYTKKGPYEEYVVWPVLYLYKGGQMLSKGVAQGMKQMKEQQ